MTVTKFHGFINNSYRFNEALEVADEGLRYVQKDKKVSDYNIPTFRIPFKGMDRLQLMVNILTNFFSFYLVA